MLISDKELKLDSHPLPSFPGYKMLEEQIKAAQVVSFDFFDTLFVRTLLSPEDVFDIIGQRFEIPGFRGLRQQAQTEAFSRMRRANAKEITLDGIYECFGNFEHCSLDALKQAESEIELGVLHPNKELLPLFHMALDLGKTVVVTSDMYLPATFFNEAFRLNGLQPVPFFISAECNATKRDSGELFDLVASTLGVPHHEILHIGDNLQSDIKQAKAKGFQTFHYAEHRRPRSWEHIAPETSLSSGLLRKHAHEIPGKSYQELGFVFGGPAAVGFLNWIGTEAKKDHIDHVLFLSRDGYVLDLIAKNSKSVNLPHFSYFRGSRTVFTLASITASNFADFLPFLLSGAEGLSPHELLDRIGVPAPKNAVLEDFGLGADVRVHPANFERLRSFLYAYRWEILKVCRRNRRALFKYLIDLGIKHGDRLALVDVGWNGTTQHAFEQAIEGFLDVKVFGYYFCLSNTRECIERQKYRRMAAFISVAATSAQLVDAIYQNRVVVELFFSAPHGSIIGLDFSPDGAIVAVEDVRSPETESMASVSMQIVNGIEIFARSYNAAVDQLNMPIRPVAMAMALIEYATKMPWANDELLTCLRNFDGWSHSANRNLLLSEY